MSVTESLNNARVFFKDGNYGEAGKYARAAWNEQRSYHALEMMYRCAIASGDLVSAVDILRMGDRKLRGRQRPEFEKLAEAFREYQAEKLREQVRQGMHDPTDDTLKLAQARMMVDGPDNTGAAYDAAVACFNLFQRTGDPEYVHKGMRYMDAARRNATHEEMDGFVGGLIEWSNNLDTEMLAQNVRAYVHDTGVTLAPELAERVLREASIRAEMEPHSAGARYDAGLINLRIAGQTDRRSKKKRLLGAGLRYLEDAARNAQEGEMAWIGPEIDRAAELMTEHIEAGLLAKTRKLMRTDIKDLRVEHFRDYLGFGKE